MLVAACGVRPFQNASNIKFGAKTPTIQELQKIVDDLAKQFAQDSSSTVLKEKLREAQVNLLEAIIKNLKSRLEKQPYHKDLQARLRDVTIELQKI